jgi:integrase
MMRVQPIRNLEQINRIRKNLKTPETAVLYALFVVGINTNLRISDLRALKWADVWIEGGTTLRDHITLHEKKTGKARRILINSPVQEALAYLLENLPRQPEASDPIFRNHLTKQVYSREYLSRRLGIEAAKVGIQDPISAHSLRKTWGYQAVITFHQPITIVQAAFNHASQAETMGYLCIKDDEITAVHEMVTL